MISMGKFETIEVHTIEVACDGGGLPTPERSAGFAQAGGALGHPKVYLHIDQENGQITCPYCSRTYVLRLTGKRVANH